MIPKPRLFSLIILPVILTSGLIKAQDSSQAKIGKNIVRFNLTNPVIFGEQNLLLGYERVINHRMSASVNGGQASLRKPTLSVFNFSDSSRIQLSKDYKDFGFTLTFDYRFYLQKENKFQAPRGVYIGPYFSYMHFERENNWSMNSPNFSGNLRTNLNLNTQMIGVEMGYQFLLWKRVALDFILIGPGVTFYQIKTSINTELNEDDSNDLFQALRDALAGRIPGYSTLLENLEFNQSGSTNTSSLGFRYVIHLGYIF